MAKSKVEYYCNSCKTPTSEKDSICKSCGSNKKFISVTVADNLTLHEKVKGKVKEMGTGDPTLKFLVGDDFSRKDDILHQREMTVDRKNNLYKEIVSRKDNGKIIHKCVEPLSRHRGYGDAKKKSKS